MKIERNGPCICGSGKKYKKCCLNKIKIYSFKVIPQHIGKFDCIIRLSERETLCDLHFYIQDALGWDNDHMFSFFIENKFGSSKKREYSANPFGEGNADICIKNLSLTAGQKIAYLFDYGDNHRFEIEVIQIELFDDRSGFRVGVIEKSGIAPEQYEYLFVDDDEEIEVGYSLPDTDNMEYSSVSKIGDDL